MNKSLRVASALVAGIAICGHSAVADTMGLSIALQGGVTLMPGSGLEKFKKDDKETTFTPGSEAKVEASNKYKEDKDADAINKFIDSITPNKDLNFVDAGVRFHMDFGDDKNEMFGFELGARFFMDKHTVSFKDANAAPAPTTPAPADDKKKDDALSTGISLLGAAIDLSARILPVHFDGGYMLFTVGIDTKINISKDFILPKRKGADGKEVEMLKKEEDKTKVLAAIKPFNFAIKGGLGGNFLDEMVHASFNVRYWFMDQVDRTNTDLEKQDPAVSRLSLGNGLDVNLCLGFNLMPLFA